MTKSSPGSRHRSGSLRNIYTKPPSFFEAGGLTYSLYYAGAGKCCKIRDWSIAGYRVRPGIVRHLTTSRAYYSTVPLTNVEGLCNSQWIQPPASSGNIIRQQCCGNFTWGLLGGILKVERMGFQRVGLQIRSTFFEIKLTIPNLQVVGRSFNGPTRSDVPPNKATCRTLGVLDTVPLRIVSSMLDNRNVFNDRYILQSCYKEF